MVKDFAGSPDALRKGNRAVGIDALIRGFASCSLALPTIDVREIIRSFVKILVRTSRSH